MTQHDQQVDTGTKQPVGGPLNVFPLQPESDQDDGDEWTEYLVDIDTHHTLLVRACSVEDAAAKALTGNPHGSDFDLHTVAHDVHVCVHSGIDDDEECDHEEE